MARKAFKEEGPLLDLPTAALILGVSRKRVFELWHRSTFRQFVVLGRFMVRLVEVELRLDSTTDAKGGVTSGYVGKARNGDKLASLNGTGSVAASLTGQRNVKRK